MCDHKTPNQSLRGIFATYIVSLLFFSLSACTSQNMTHDNSAYVPSENVSGNTLTPTPEVSTSTQIPTQTPIPQPTPTPTRSARGAFDQAVEFCDQAFEQEIHFVQLGKPEGAVYAIIQTVNRSGIEFPWEELSLNNLISDDLVARSIDQLSTIICIRDTLHELTIFEYDDGESGFTRDWELRFVRWPDGEFFGAYRVSKFPPYVKVGPGPGIAVEPKEDFGAFVQMYFKGGIILNVETYSDIAFVLQSGKLLYAYCITLDVQCEENGFAFYEPTTQDIEFFPIDDYLTKFVLFPDGKTLAIADYDVLIWDLEKSQTIAELDTNAVIPEVGLSPDGRRIIIGTKDWIEVWNINEGERVWRLNYEGNVPPSVGFVLNNEYLVISPFYDHALIWDIQNDQAVSRLYGAGHALAISPNNKIIAVNVDEKSVLIFDVEKNEEVWTLSEFESSVDAMAFSMDGPWLAVGLGHNVQIWNIETGELVHEIEGMVSFVDEIAFSPESKYLATRNTDRTITVWSLDLEK